MLPGSATGFVGLESLDDDAVRRHYEAYCRRQAARLVRMLPRDAIRPLYRRARADAIASGAGTLDEDPLELLLLFCRELLPLPPLDVWQADLRSHPAAHIDDMEDTAETPTVDAPSTLEARVFSHVGKRWTAELRSYRDADLWRGYIAFRDPRSGAVHRTASVFCEHGAGDLRNRFASFDVNTLEAFLRSALP